MENSKLSLRVRELERKLAKVGCSSGVSLGKGVGDGNEEVISGGGNNLNSDKVMRKLGELTEHARE